MVKDCHGQSEDADIDVCDFDQAFWRCWRLGVDLVDVELENTGNGDKLSGIAGHDCHEKSDKKGNSARLPKHSASSENSS
jgi:hypothetical protein